MNDEPGREVPYIDREIGAHTYRAAQLRLTKWAELTEHLAEMLGKPFAQALRGGSVDVDKLMQADTTMAILALVVEKLSARNLLKLLDLAQGSLRLESASGEFNAKKLEQWHTHFQFNMGELAPAMMLFLEAQYAVFFEGLRQSVPARPSVPQDPPSNSDLDTTRSRST
jgi:hypothetical protein